MFKRPVYQVLMKRIAEPRRFIQVLSGPRQTGKTTVAKQIINDISIPRHYASADAPTLKDQAWLEQQWETARFNVKSGDKGLLALDEVQKIGGWSETVKKLWDEDTFNDVPLHVLLLGSSPLLMQQGLTESLAGRFEVNPATHWSFAEMQEAFGWELDQYIYFGGYPGGAALVNDRKRWAGYIQNALVETTISRDILLMTRVDKPALLRRLFELGSSYSGQVLSFQKMLGQLQDAGNTTTLSHYLQLLESAGLIAGLSKYAGQRVRRRASSPKLLVLNTALMTSQCQFSLEKAKQDGDFWGRLVESAVGASLVNGLKNEDADVFYWSGRNREVDFVLSRGKTLIALEVKSGRKKPSLPGMDAFSKEFPHARKMLVGTGGIPLADFIRASPIKWLS